MNSIVITKEQAQKEIEKLVQRFDEQKESYKKSYNETQTRGDFINPLWKALNWDVYNESGYAEGFREVIPEDSLKVREKERDTTKHPDYSFRLGNGTPLFFLEAKKPGIAIKDNKEIAYQIRRYGWNAKMSISIVTNFEEFAVYDCTTKPMSTDKAGIGMIEYIHYSKYISEFDSIWNTFNKENVLRGSLDKYIQSNKSKKRTITVDKDFLTSLDKWRIKIATNIAFCNKGISEDELNFIVQQMIDRIIFLRIAEDRNIEPYETLKTHIKKGNYYKNLFKQFEDADGKYNSGLFDFKKDTISRNIKIDNKTIQTIINELYLPKSPYEFSVISVEILGSAYEQFLGKQILLSKSGSVRITEKPEVRKSGGVYYTPQYIVNYIVENSIGKLIENKTPEEVSNIKIVDPACGSGSFLIGAYQYLLNWHKDYYTKNNNQSTGDKNNPLTPDGELATAEKKRILLNNIYGVDSDSNAVEVTKLSLLLKCMEGETQASIKQLSLFNERVLPTLDENIKNGNSLIDIDYYDNKLDFGEDQKVIPFSWKKNFPEVFKQCGFDCVIGNPPYVKEYTSRETFEQVKKSHLAKYYQGKMDLWYFFGCYGIDILKPNGLLGFIVPNNWVTNAGASILRNKVLTDSTIKNIIDFGSYMVFDNASIQTMILILEKQKQESYSFDFRKLEIQKPTIQHIQKLIKKESEQGLKYIEPYIYTNELKDKFLVFSDNETERLLNKIQAKQNFVLDARKEVAQGIVAAPDEYFLVENMQIYNNKEKTFLKPYYTSAKRYKIEKNEAYIFYLCEKTFDKKSIDDYPNIKKHFEPFKKKLKEVKKKYGTPNKPYYYLHRERDEKFFIEGEKIVSQIRTLQPSFLYTHECYYGSRALYFIKTERIDQKYLTAILNSKLIAFWLKHKGKIQGNLFKLDKEPILEIPIFDTPNDATKDQIIKHVDQLLHLNKELQTATLHSQIEQLQSKISYNEDSIDAIVYELYGLTEEEIKIVEN